MKFFNLLYDLLRHLGDDAKWKALVDYIGTPTLYGVLIAIIFAETGLVVTPFLPGDSLLFAVGAVGARHDVGINLLVIGPLLLLAALTGDTVNYFMGYKLGPAVFKNENSKLLSKKHLIRAQAFYEKYGAKTIVLARFVPIIRTFAPFVAGVGRMNFFRFATFSVTGGALWVSICLSAGYLFGNVKIVKERFELVVLAIIIISLVPMAVELIKARRDAKQGYDPLLEATTLGEDPRVVQTPEPVGKVD